MDLSPDHVVRPENRQAYSLSTLNALSTRLRPGGRLAIRGQALSRAYRRALEEVFAEVEVIEVAARTPAGGVLYVAGN
jgi:hypothetical protein